MKIVRLGAQIDSKYNEELKKLGDYFAYENLSKDESETIQQIGNADIIISALLPITRNVLNKVPNLKLISLATTGFNSVDLDAANEKNITVCYAPGYATESVAEHTIGLMLAASRLSFMASCDLQSGSYDRRLYQGKDLRQKTLGIIGMGRIGTRVSEIASKGFDMKVLSYDRNSTRKDFEYLLSKSDVITLHIPLTKETENMIGNKEFACMKNGVVIVNTARGRIINREALIKALDSGKVFSAGFDVLFHEPMDIHNPLIRHKRVFVTPHISYNSDESIRERSRMVVSNIRNFLEGNLKEVICVPKKKL